MARVWESVTILIACFVLVQCNANDTCSLTMFGNDTGAYLACTAQVALQANWFPSPIAGLFSYLVWNGFDGFWQNGAVLEPMVSFMEYANHSRYVSVVRNSWRPLYSLLEAYGPYPSFDDMCWYGLSYVRIYEVLGYEEFLATALDIYNWVWQTGWDFSGHCGGGFFFDDSRLSKPTITNVQMFQLGAKLYRIYKKDDIWNKTIEVYNFIMNNSIINTTSYLVSDSTTWTCQGNGNYGPTYSSGVLMGALVELYKQTNVSSYIDLAVKLADATILNHTDNVTGIFREYCDPQCDDDAKMFKGIFVRNLRYLIDALPEGDSTKAGYKIWLKHNAMGIIKYDMCDKSPISLCNITFKDGPPYFNVSGPVFSPDWIGPVTYGAPMQQACVLDLFVASINAGTRCTGDYCSFDPPYPPPQPLTCESHPCPPDEPCCEYSPYTTYTCCESTQKCQNGICV
ncbi:hypothetical protein ACJMK2_022388 [Sinanodonta woodiana]|uniref:Uncharacterized protein n=1 Tax=Sinanodonta woodiana TaxID=1069815 RepID=A0ABD3TKU7_SINWO